jgi:hypothetical protein
MGNLQTNPELLERMKEATRLPQSSAALLNQKISFILGAMDANNDITVEKVEEILARHEGRLLFAK